MDYFIHRNKHFRYTINMTKKEILNQKISSKLYFKLALAIPIILFFTLTILIMLNSNLEFCGSKKCLEYFITTFNLPIKLLGLSFITMGATFAYYRSESTYEQNERQIEQFTQANYITFRDDFFELLKEQDYDLKAVNIPRSWLFSTLYPNAKKGDYTLCAKFEEFITWEENGQGFTGALNALVDTRGADKYNAGSYIQVGTFIIELRTMLNLKDADVNIGFDSGAIFTGRYAEDIINIANDTFFIVSTVNAFEGWRFFDNIKRRSWKSSIDLLVRIKQDSEAISNFFDNAHSSGLSTILAREELENLHDYDLRNKLPDELKDNNAAKQYIFDMYTKSLFRNLPKELKEALAIALNIKIEEEST